MSVKYLYVPTPPGNSNIIYCDVFRMFDGNGVTMEHVGRFRGNKETQEIVELLNATRGDTPAAIYSTKKAICIAMRVCELLGIDYTEATAEQVASQVRSLMIAR